MAFVEAADYDEYLRRKREKAAAAASPTASPAWQAAAQRIAAPDMTLEPTFQSPPRPPVDVLPPAALLPSLEAGQPLSFGSTVPSGWTAPPSQPPPAETPPAQPDWWRAMLEPPPPRPPAAEPTIPMPTQPVSPYGADVELPDLRRASVQLPGEALGALLGAYNEYVGAPVSGLATEAANPTLLTGAKPLPSPAESGGIGPWWRGLAERQMAREAAGEPNIPLGNVLPLTPGEWAGVAKGVAGPALSAAKGLAREAAPAVAEAARAPVLRRLVPGATIEDANAFLERTAARDTEIGQRLDDIYNRVSELRAQKAAMQESGNIVRPPRAGSLTNEQLIAVAEAHGVSPYQKNWWDALDPEAFKELGPGRRSAKLPTAAQIQAEIGGLEREQLALATEQKVLRRDADKAFNAMAEQPAAASPAETLSLRGQEAMPAKPKSEQAGMFAPGEVKPQMKGAAPGSAATTGDLLGAPQFENEAARAQWESEQAMRAGQTEMRPVETTTPPVAVRPPAEVAAEVPQPLIAVSPDDISYQRAVNAYNGVSWTPETRGKQVQADYVAHMQQVQDALRPLAQNPDQLAKLRDGLERYRQGYLQRLGAYLDAKSRVVSSFIAGPSRFPAQQMEKRGQIEHNRLNEWLDWSQKAQAAMRREIAPETARVISSDNPEAVRLLQEKIAKATDMQQRMTEGNKIVRRKDLNDEEKVKQLVALGLKETNAREVLKPDFAGRIGFPDYALKNNSAELRRLQGRVEEMTRSRATPGGEMPFEGGRIVDNAEANRIQIFFDAIPDKATRERLVANGFKWAPSQHAWQRQRTDNARSAVERLFPTARKVEGAVPEDAFVEPQTLEYAKETVPPAEVAKPAEVAPAPTAPVAPAPTAEEYFARRAEAPDAAFAEQARRDQPTVDEFNRRLQEEIAAKEAAAGVPAELPVKPPAPVPPAEPGVPPTAETVPPPQPPKPPITEPAPPAEPPPPSQPGFAGNIRLAKYPEPLREDIKTVYDQDPAKFEAARRGVRSDAEVRTDAVGLIDSVGGNGERSVKRWRPGQAWNAEEVLALREVLAAKTRGVLDAQAALAQGGDSTANLVRLRLAIEDQNAAQSAVAGVTAEAGRALRQFRQNVEGVIASGDEKRLRAVLDRLGGRQNAEELATALSKVDLGNQEAVYKFIRNATKPRRADYLTEIFYNSILSGIRTHEVNTIGNTLAAILSPAETLASAAVEAPLAAISRRPPERFVGEVKPEVFAMARALPEGVRKALYILKNGYSWDDVAKLEIRRPQAFKGALGTAINVPSRALTAADALFRSIHYDAALNAGAYRMAKREGLSGEALSGRIAELLATPPDALLSYARKMEDYRVYQQAPGQFARGLVQLRDTDVGSFQPLRLALPFVQTPANLVKYGLERSPLGVLNPTLWRNVARRDPEAADQLARWLVGSTIAAAVAYYAADGRITGAAPESPAARDLFYRQGKQPYSIRAGDRWVPYNRFEPFNQPLAQVAAAVEAMREGKDTREAVGSIVAGIGKNLISQTYMSGVSDLLNAIDDPARYGANIFERAAVGMVVPFSAATRTIAQTVDPTIRQSKGLAEELQATVPGLSQNLPPRLTAFGEESQRESPAYLPVEARTARNDPVDEELARLKVTVGFAGNSIRHVALSPQEQQDYQRLAGGQIKQMLDTVVQSPIYQGLRDDAKTALLERAIRRAHDRAALEMLGRIDRDEIRRRLAGAATR